VRRLRMDIKMAAIMWDAGWTLKLPGDSMPIRKEEDRQRAYHGYLVDINGEAILLKTIHLLSENWESVK
jgi:hypothetical protein